MTVIKPEGLSPCFGSLVSPDILSSCKFKWNPRAKQSYYTITLYASDGATVLKTYSGNSFNSELETSSIGYPFLHGSTYYWDVSVNGGNKSDKAKFVYKNNPQRQGISWASSEPLVGNEVFKSGRLQEIKNNILILLRKYSFVDSSILSKTNNLFTGNIVPLKKDFTDLQAILQYVGEKEGVTYIHNSNGYIEVRQNYGPTKKWDITDSNFSAYLFAPEINDTAPILRIPVWVGDSLGVSDLNNIVDYINWLINRPPAPVKNLSITMDSPTMYSVGNVVASHSDNTDTTIDVSWEVSEIPASNVLVHFNTMPSSGDIWFYQVRLSYGPSGAYSHTMFFDKESLPSGSVISFSIDWDDLFTLDNLNASIQKVEVFAIDHSANISVLADEMTKYGSDLKVPLGVDRYEMQVQLLGLSATNYNVSGSWTSHYLGTSPMITWTISGQEHTIFHRVRAIDKTGLLTDWAYSPSIVFDPLTPPTAPSAVKISEARIHGLTWNWNHGARVEKYRCHLYDGNWAWVGEWFVDDWSKGWLPNWTSHENLAANFGYNMAIRSENRVGTSDWVWVSGSTKPDITQYWWDSTGAKSWRNNWGWRNDNNRVYQGEWCEIAGSPHQTAAAGTCWGKHKGMWFFNYGDIRSKLAGKAILEAKLYVKREDTYHGYYSDQVLHLWLHGYGSQPGGEPGFFDHYEVRDPTFAKGESAWITLPNYYVEKIRDGSAAGFGLFVPDYGRSPYVYCNAWSQLYVKAQG